jgi:hypothetical protein
MHKITTQYLNFVRRWVLLTGIALVLQPSFGQRIDGFYHGNFSGKRALMEIKRSDDLIVGTVMETPPDKWYFSATLHESSFAGASTIGLPSIAYVRALLKNDTLWVTVQTPDSTKTGSFTKFDKNFGGTLLYQKVDDAAKQRDPNLSGKWICVGGTSPNASDEMGSYTIYHPDGKVEVDWEHIVIQVRKLMSRHGIKVDRPIPRSEVSWWTEGNILHRRFASEYSDLHAELKYEIKGDSLSITGGMKNYIAFYVRESPAPTKQRD